MRRAVLLLLIVPLSGLAACAGAPAWNKANVAASRRDADFAACRRYADDQFGPAALADQALERSSNPMVMAERTDDRKRFTALVDSCMRAKGYQPAK